MKWRTGLLLGCLVLALPGSVAKAGAITQIVAFGVLLETFGFDAESLDAPEHPASFAHGARTLDSEHQAVEPAEKVGLECARLEHLGQAA